MEMFLHSSDGRWLLRCLSREGGGEGVRMQFHGEWEERKWSIDGDYIARLLHNI